MNHAFPRTSSLLIGGALILFAGAASTRGGGVQSGVNSVPANASRQLSSCGSCHSGSQPTAGRTGAPSVYLTVNQPLLHAGEATAVATGAIGGLSGTNGGFLCEATAGTFTAGPDSRVNTGGNSITHSTAFARDWTFTYTAPSTVGVVEITSAVMTSNGSGSSGDRFSFSGFDANSTIGTPTWVYVLPPGVVGLGRSCPDGYGNYSVLGSPSEPVLGNLAFGFEMVGIAPNSVALIFYNMNPPGFTSVDLGAVLGLTGCTGYISGSMLENSALTGSGVAARAQGRCTFNLGIPNNSALLGLAFQSQAAYLDPSATTRAMNVSVTNGLSVTVH